MLRPELDDLGLAGLVWAWRQ